MLHQNRALFYMKLVNALIFIIAIFLMFSFLIPNSSRADGIDLIPSLKIYGGYNDNILFTDDDEIEDFYSKIIPQLRWNLKDVTYNVGLNIYGEFTRFKEENELDTDNYRGVVDGRYRISKRMTINGEISYLKDTTLDSELEETGRVLMRDDRERNRAFTSFSYELNEKSNIEFDYQYTDITYESEENVDRYRHRFRTPYRIWLNDKLDRLVIRPSYTTVDFENDEKLDYYNISFGWIHLFSATLSMRSFLGYGYAIETDQDSETIERTGNADIRFIYDGEISSLETGFKTNIEADEIGNLEVVDRLYCDADYLLTERLNLNLSFNAYGTRSVEKYGDYDSVYYDTKIGLSYNLTERYLLSMAYRYSLEDNRESSEGDDKNRSIFEIRISFRFPMQV